MDILFKHGWVMFISVTIANGLIFKYNAKKYIAENPTLAPGYQNFFKGWLVFGNIPWVILMIGNLSGMTHHTFDFFNPRAMNPIVLIFHFSIILLWILSVRWIYFKNGAEFFETHPGLLQRSGFGENKKVTARQIKIFFPLFLLGGIAGMIMMWVMEVPIENF